MQLKKTYRVKSTSRSQLIYLMLGELHVHRHAIGSHTVGAHAVGTHALRRHATILLHGLLSHKSLSLLLDENLLLAHLGHGIRVTD